MQYLNFNEIVLCRIKYPILLFILSFFAIPFLHGQGVSRYDPVTNAKPLIDMSSLENWPIVHHPLISPDGSYVSYVIERQPAESRTLFIATADGSWKKSFIGISDGFFSEDSKTFVFKMADTIYLIGLGTDQLERITDVKNMRILDKEKGVWLAYQLKSNNILTLLNLESKHVMEFSDVDQFYYNNTGETILLQNSLSNSLRCIRMSEDSVKTIWSSNNEKIISCNFDKTGAQLCFLTSGSSGNKGNNIWYYKKDMIRALKIASDQSTGIDSNLLISLKEVQFSQTGNYIVFELKPVPDTLKEKQGAASVDVWHYKDVFLQSQQLNRPLGQVKGTFMATISVNGGSVIQVEKFGENVIVAPFQANADIAIVINKQNLQWWRRGHEQGYYIVSLGNGVRKLIYQGWLSNIVVSPNGKYVAYFDGKKGNYLSYELKTQIFRNISEKIKEPLSNEYYQSIPNRTYPIAVGIAGWLREDSALMVYDNYDIWRLDPLAVQQPINITHGYGRKQNTKLRLIFQNSENITDTSGMLLSGFNVKTKHNGFFRCYPNMSMNPKKLTMGPFHFYRLDSQVPNNADAFDQGMKPIKAKKANVWLVKRQSAIEAPNYFLTSSFESFRSITDIQPQQKYNWLSTELITWKQLDGTLSQGILYKPENFDPHKRYPIIFSYYETFSFRLYEYPYPNFTGARLDIPWFVSQGYLIFTPDIHYSIADVSGKVAGDAAVNSIVSAARYLSSRPYVDRTRMGIQGHSYGGGETLYIITHSNLFAAACAAAPTVSNEISAYLDIHTPNGKPGGPFRLSHAEIGHDRIGATLWQRPDLYIRASPVFRAHHVTTPLLILHNHGDGSCQWSQGIEMFMALRRLEKKVWLLQYDGEDHGVGGANAVDFTIRLNQFFDHYLKAALPPKWMTQGIPAKLKRIETGFELDASETKK